MSTRRAAILGGLFLAFAGIGLWGLHAGGADVAPQDEANPAVTEAPDVDSGLVLIPNDPVQAQAVRERLRQKLEQNRAIVMAEAAEKARLRANSWEGVKFVPSAKPESPEFARQKELADLFRSKESIPQARLDACKKTITYPGFRCIGWEGEVAKVVESKDGTTIELLVRPTLVTERGSSAHAAGSVKETWRVDSANNLIFEKVDPKPGVMGIATTP